MDLSLDTLSAYGSRSTATVADVPTTLDALTDGDLYGIEDYERYFPATTAATCTEYVIADRYPASIRARLGYAVVDGAVDLDHVDQELTPHPQIPARWELEEYVWDDEESLFLMDDHNHAAAAWLAAYHDGEIDADTAVIHVDRHADDGALDITEHYPAPPETVQEGERIIGMHFSIGAFIRPMAAWETIDLDNVTCWGVGDGPHDPARIEEIADESDTTILDLDLDVFYDNAIDNPVPVYDAIRTAHDDATLTTVAMSPGYIPQDDAERHLDAIFG